MTIEFVCESTLEFDAATGRATQCQHRFEVADEKAGDIIECPECQNFVAVPQLAKRSPSVAKRRSVPAHVDAGSDLAKASQGNDLFGEGLPTEPAPSKLQYQKFDSYDQCRKCGATLSPSRPDCPNCGAPRKAFWGSDDSLDKIKHQPAGFQRWLLSIISAGHNGRTIWITINVLLGMFAIATIGAALYVFDVLSFVLIFLVVAMTFLYWRFSKQTIRIAHEKAAPLTFWQRSGWNLMLKWLRVVDWKVPLSPLTAPVVIDCRQSRLANADLASLPQIEAADVLDLEGVGISDEGLRYLRNLHKLKYLVLNKNEVTVEGVYRLQQTIPKCWIWY